MRSVFTVQCFIYKVSYCFVLRYAKCPYYIVLGLGLKIKRLGGKVSSRSAATLAAVKRPYWWLLGTVAPPPTPPEAGSAPDMTVREQSAQARRLPAVM